MIALARDRFGAAWAGALGSTRRVDRLSPIVIAGRLLAILSLSTFALCLTASGASADSMARNFDSRITGFVHPWGITVDPADDVWITDPGNGGLISEYGPYPSQAKLSEQDGGGQFASGEQIRSLALSATTNRLFVADSAPGAIDVFDPVSFVEQWKLGPDLLFVAVDNSASASAGRVYIVKRFSGVVEAFDENQDPIDFECAACSYIHENQITGTPSEPFSELSNVAVDATGDIFVAEQSGAIDQFKSSGEFVQEIDRADTPNGALTPFGVAVDPTNGDIVVNSSNAITEFSSTGEYLDEITGPSEGTPFQVVPASGGIAVNSEGYLYFAESGSGNVDIFSPVFPLPKVINEAVSNPARNSVTLNATVDPNGGGDITACHFEYGTDTSYGLGSVPCSPDPGSNPPSSHFSGPTQVHADLTSLRTETTYHYRLVASNPRGTQHGEDRTYTTPVAVEGVTTDPATAVTNTTAVLNGHYTGNGDDTSYYFQYGTSTSYNHTAPAPPGADNGSAVGLQAVPPIEVSSLVPGALYHYRLVAQNASGVAFGADRTFTTEQAPTIDAFSSANLSATSANLRALSLIHI